jgi:hypothetical protein
MAIPHRGIAFRSRWVVAIGLASVIVALLLAVGHALSLLARDHVIRALKEAYASGGLPPLAGPRATKKGCRGGGFRETLTGRESYSVVCGALSS